MESSRYDLHKLQKTIMRVSLAWRQPMIDHAPPWATRIFGPAGRRLDSLFIDHGIFRLLYLNKHKLGEHAWRSAQPAPHDIRAMARKGVRTIINLRGERQCGSYWLERSACERAGITLINFRVRSRAAPPPEVLRAARELFDSIEYPMVLHCKSGADRAGLMSVLFMFLKLGVPLAVAKRQLGARYGHFRITETGILDYFFERYLADTRQRPMPFFDWVDNVYDPVELKRSFQAERRGSRIIDTLLWRE